jgi:DNA modification methylase
MIICGDALIELRKLDNESVDLCVTSPPHFGVNDYGGTLGRELTIHAYIENLLKICEQIHRVLKPDGKMMWVMGGYPLITMAFCVRMCAGQWNLQCAHVGDKTNQGTYDSILFFNKTQFIQESRVVEFEQKIDPDTKWGLIPYRMAEAFIQDYSKPMDTVLDPFAGSGAVGVIAKRLCREFIMIELIEAYIPVIESRINSSAGLIMAEANA